MGTKMFDRVTIGVREKPVSRDHNREFSQMDRTLRDVLMVLLAPRTSASSSARNPSTGFVADSLRVVPSTPAAMSITINPGYGFVYDPSDLPTSLGDPDIEGVDDLSPYKPVVLDGAITFAVPAPPSNPNVRTDLIEILTNRLLVDQESRLQLDTATKTFGPKDFFKTLSCLLDGSTGVSTGGANSTAAVSYKVGTVMAAGGNGVGTPPATTPGYTAIAAVNVLSSTTSIDGNAIIDLRPLLFPNGVCNASVRFRMQWNSGTPIVTIHHMIAPPGIEIAIDPTFHNGTPVKGKTFIHVFGGKLAHMTWRASSSDFQLAGHPICAQVEDFSTPNIAAYSDVAQGQAASMVPVPAIGRNQLTGIASLQNFALLNAGPSTSDASLEDLLIDVAIELGW